MALSLVIPFFKLSMFTISEEQASGAKQVLIYLNQLLQVKTLLLIHGISLLNGITQVLLMRTLTNTTWHLEIMIHLKKYLETMEEYFLVKLSRYVVENSMSDCFCSETIFG